MRLSLLALAWLAGILLGARLELPAWSLCLALAPLPLLSVPRLRGTALMFGLCLLALLGGAVYYETSRDLPRLAQYNGREVALRAVVSADPEARDQNTKLRLSATAVNVDGAWTETDGDVIVYAPRYPAYEYGDALELSGELETPAAFDGFDYAGYLARQDIYSVMFYPETERTATGRGNALLGGIYRARNRLADALGQALPEPQASLAQGILLGLRGNIPPEVSADFQLSGTTHILAISGMNLTLLSGLLVSLLVWLLGRRHYLYVWLAGAAIWGYVVLCGASPSVVRAAVMASVFLLAELSGRQKSGGPALMLTAAVMAAANPNVLWDASFQLSFLAMCGLIYIYPWLRQPAQSLAERMAFGKAGWGYALDSLAISLAATLAVWPALACHFGVVALAGPVATLLATPALPFIILLSLATALAGLVWSAAGQAIGLVAWLFTSYLLLVARVFSRLPALNMNLPTVALWAYYALLALMVWWLTRLRRRRVMEES